MRDAAPSLFVQAEGETAEEYGAKVCLRDRVAWPLSGGLPADTQDLMLELLALGYEKYLVFEMKNRYFLSHL